MGRGLGGWMGGNWAETIRSIWEDDRRWDFLLWGIWTVEMKRWDRRECIVV